MTTIRFLPASQRPSRRWRNGGGITHDVAVFPASSDDDDFSWRASLAVVDVPAPFSPWPSTDRILTLGSGAIALTIDGDTHHLNDHSAPLAFSGTAQAHGTPHAPCRILNLMLRQGKARATVTRWNSPQAAIADHLLLFAFNPCTLIIGAESYTLKTADALLLETPDAAQIFRPSGVLIAAEIFLL